jgi:hypothetical protein
MMTSVPQDTHPHAISRPIVENRQAHGRRHSKDFGVDVSQFDFLDFGGSKGASLRFGVKYFQGKRGLAIDNNPAKVKVMLEQGLDCLEADATKLDLPDGAVRFVIMSHFLEHLPDLATVNATIQSAARVATDFLYIQGPYFDGDEYLKTLGFKFFYSDWTGHTCHMTIERLSRLLDECGLIDYEMRFELPAITDSASSYIHPIESTPNQHHYDQNKHPPKRYYIFSRPVYPGFTCAVKLRDLPYEVYRRQTTAAIDHDEMPK